MREKELLSLTAFCTIFWFIFVIYRVGPVECSSSESEQHSDIVYLFNNISVKNKIVQKIFFNTTLNRLVFDPENGKVRFF